MCCLVTKPVFLACTKTIFFLQVAVLELSVFINQYVHMAGDVYNRI